MERRPFLMIGLPTMIAGVAALLLVRPSSDAPATDSTPAPAPPTATAAADRPEFLGVILPERAVEVAAPIAGRLASVEVGLGDSVTEGQVLARLDTAALEAERAAAEAALEAARARARAAAVDQEQAEQVLAETRALGAHVARREAEDHRFAADRAAADRELAEAEVRAAEAALDRLRHALAEATLRAPMDGLVALCPLDPGEAVAAGQTVVHLSSRALRVRFAVDQGRASLLSPSAPIEVSIPESGLLLRGRLSRSSPWVDPAAGMILVEAALDTPEGAAGRAAAAGVAVRVRIGGDGA